MVNLARSQLRARREPPVEDWTGGRAMEGFLWIDAEPSPEQRQEARELHDRVWKALGELPPEQQETVQLHYVGGAAGVGDRGPRRVAVGHGQGAAAPRPGGCSPRSSKRWRYPPRVDDVIYRAPRDEPVRYAVATQEGNLGRLRVIFLKEREGQRVLPIWVGAHEGDMIALRLGGVSTPRPMSLMLMARVLELAEITVERVVVTALRDTIFYAVLSVRIGDRLHDVDARPSDAVTIALYNSAPIFVTPEMLALPIVIDAGAALPQLEEYHQRKQAEQNREPEAPAMEWRSFRTLPDPRTPRA